MQTTWKLLRKILRRVLENRKSIITYHPCEGIEVVFVSVKDNLPLEGRKRPPKESTI